jgi:hypothetical protein
MRIGAARGPDRTRTPSVYGFLSNAGQRRSLVSTVVRSAARDTGSARYGQTKQWKKHDHEPRGSLRGSLSIVGAALLPGV